MTLMSSILCRIAPGKSKASPGCRCFLQVLLEVLKRMTSEFDCVLHHLCRKVQYPLPVPAEFQNADRGIVTDDILGDVLFSIGDSG